MMMSSYPGALSSIDDWYVMDSGLATMETTNDVLNNTLYTMYVKPQSLFTWHRVRVCNALTTSAQEWVHTFAKYNSGTYNNQWMALEYKSFVRGQPLKDGLLWIAEQVMYSIVLLLFFFFLISIHTVQQMPGSVAFADVTSVLERGYWASYNVPSIESVYVKSGYPALVAKQGPSHSYDLAPRSRLYRSYVNSMDRNLSTVQKFMRYNDYKNDALQNGNPSWAIMSRYDLEPMSNHPSPFGGYDSKLCNLDMLYTMSARVQAGPTHDDLPPFSWNDWPQYMHDGLPITYDFDWITITPKL